MNGDVSPFQLDNCQKIADIHVSSVLSGVYSCLGVV